MPLTYYPYPISNINYMQPPQQFNGQNHQQGFANHLNNFGEMNNSFNLPLSSSRAIYPKKNKK